MKGNRIIMGWFKKKSKRDRKTPSEQKTHKATEVFEEDETVTINMFQESDEGIPGYPAGFQSEPDSGFVRHLRKGLSKTREFLTTDIENLFKSGTTMEDLWEEIEERLITSDIGVQTTMDIMENISKKFPKISNPDQLKAVLKEEIISLLNTQTAAPEKATAKPHVVMIVGINGVGKTTTIGKLAAKSSDEGKKVLIAAADTFRAAAIEQLVIWAEKAGADIVRHRDNADPAAVAYDGVEAAVARGKDIVFVDTAGRLHTKISLMEELKKIRRALSKKIPDAPHEVLLVLDATTGQNALSQVRLFNNAIGVTGIALTKLDGTAKGGIVVSICSTFDIPLKYICVGEQLEDLHDFDPALFADALF